MTTPDLPKDATPYLIRITSVRDDQPETPVVSHTDAEDAASRISPYPELTGALHPAEGYWNVWLPNYMTDLAWESGIYLELTVGGYRLEIELDPA